MDIIINIIAALFALSSIIMIHEFGHFYFAKKAGILCYDFSLGMGPVLWKTKKGETTYGVRAFPIGGFVAMAGEEVTLEQFDKGDTIGIILKDGKVKEIILDNAKKAEISGEVFAYDLYGEEGGELFVDIAADGGRKIFSVHRDARYIFTEKKELQIAPYDRCFESKTMLQRFLSIVFGPVMNFIFAIILFIIVALFMGFPSYESSTIGEVNGQADEILFKGDTITSINGMVVEDWEDIGNILDSSLGVNETIAISVNRDGVIVDETINPMFFLGNLGVYGKNEASVINGVKIDVYTTKASEAGLIDGDIITNVDGVTIDSWNDLINHAMGLNGGDSSVTYLRDGEENTVTVSVLENDTLEVVGIESAEMKIGIAPEMKFDFFRSIGAGFTGSWGVVENIFGTLGLLFGGSNDVGVNDLSGPVGIISLISNSLNGGVLNYIAFIAFLSVNIGLINLFPIPGLDGGRIVFLGIEAARRKKMDKKVENMINNIVIMLLFAFIIYVTFNDVMRLF